MTLLAKMFTKTSADKLRPPDLTKPVDDQIGTYWVWTNAGLPLGNNPSELLQQTAEGATCEKATVLAGLARHESEWVGSLSQGTGQHRRGCAGATRKRF